MMIMQLEYNVKEKKRIYLLLKSFVIRNIIRILQPILKVAY